jgi:DNA polymerase-3 subunit delta'
MNASAANALLKGLEEPPAAAMFLLVSHRPARLLPTVRSRCVSLAVPLPPPDAALAWLRAEGLKDAERWLAYAGGAPLRALAFAAQAENLDRLMRGIAANADLLVDDRESLEALAEALQKMALDRAFTASGLPAKYRTGSAKPDRSRAKAWLDYARQMGQNRALARHPVNPRLFAAEMLATMPPDEKLQ